MRQGAVHFRAMQGSTAAGVSVAFTLVQSVVQVPVLLHFWSSDTYGTYMSLLASVAMVTSLDSGHQYYVGNLFNDRWVRNRSQLQVELSSSVRMAGVLAATEILIGGGLVLCGGLAWGAHRATADTGRGLGAALTLYLIYWGVFGAVGGLLVRLYQPAGLFARSQWLGIASRFLAFAALVGAAAGGGKVFGAMAVQVAVGTVFNVFLLRDLRRQIPEVYPWWRGGHWGTAWRNFMSSLVLTGNGVAEQLAGSGLVLLVGRMLSPGAVAIFTTVRTVANTALQGTGVLLSPLGPDIVRYHVKGEGTKLVAVFSASWLLGNTLIAAGLALGVLVLEPIYTLWTRGLMPLDRSLFAALGLAVAIRQWAAPCQTYLASINRLRPQTTMAVARAVLGLGTAGALLPWLGLPAAGLGVLAAEVGAALIATKAAQAELLRFGTVFPRRPAALALAQLGLAAVVLGAFAARVPGLGVWSGAALIGVCVLGWQQWRALSDGVRSRLWSLVDHLRKRG